MVRDYSWVVDNWDIKRVVVNFGLSSLAMLSLLFILKPILTKSSISKNIVFVLMVLPILVQMSHFEVYKSFTSSFGFHAFAEDSWMVLVLWVNQFSLFKSMVILSVVYWSINLLSNAQKKTIKWRYSLNVLGFIFVIFTHNF